MPRLIVTIKLVGLMALLLGRAPFPEVQGTIANVILCMFRVRSSCTELFLQCGVPPSRSECHRAYLLLPKSSKRILCVCTWMYLAHVGTCMTQQFIEGPDPPPFSHGSCLRLAMMQTGPIVSNCCIAYICMQSLWRYSKKFSE